MKIELELPDWTEGRTISILAGMEMVAIKPPNLPIKVVTQRCTNCGKCCKSKTGGAWPLGSEKDECSYHKVDSTGLSQCSLGMYRPLGCCLDPYRGGETFCQIKLAIQE